MQSTTFDYDVTHLARGNNNADVARWIFESLKPLRTACMENQYNFMAYLIEMTEVEALRVMTEQQNKRVF